MALLFKVYSPESEKEIHMGFIGAAQMRIMRDFSPNSPGYLAIFCDADGDEGRVVEMDEAIIKSAEEGNPVNIREFEGFTKLFTIGEQVMAATVDFQAEPDKPAELTVKYYQPGLN
jgi:hypothetical protein